jgi:hypothetical protein
MESQVMFLDCPAYMDSHGAARCALPAEVEYRYGASSDDGLLESAKIRCPLGHWFNGTIESLTRDKNPDPAAGRAVGTDPAGAARSRPAGTAGLPRNP